MTMQIKMCSKDEKNFYKMKIMCMLKQYFQSKTFDINIFIQMYLRQDKRESQTILRVYFSQPILFVVECSKFVLILNQTFIQVAVEEMGHVAYKY